MALMMCCAVVEVFSKLFLITILEIGTIITHCTDENTGAQEGVAWPKLIQLLSEGKGVLLQSQVLH